MKEKICNKCFGKGYRTELKGIRDLRHIRDGKTISDFSGEPIDSFTAMIFCDCDRGKELEIRVKEYADWKIKECLPEKNNTEIKATGEGGIYEQGGQDGWNACIDQTLINKDKIK